VHTTHACTQPGIAQSSKCAIHKKSHDQKSSSSASFLSVVKSFELCKNSAAVCWTSARNSPWANKLPGREGLKLRAIGADLLETKLFCPKSSPRLRSTGQKVIGAVECKYCWVVAPAKHFCEASSNKEGDRRHDGGKLCSAERASCRKLELCAASPGHSNWRL
jgi:hypothetical protein